MAGKNTFKFSVLNANKLIYHGDVESVIVMGDETEYEILAYHSPLLGLLNGREIIVDHSLYIQLEKGLVRFFNNECVILGEEKLDMSEVDKLKEEEEEDK